MERARRIIVKWFGRSDCMAVNYFVCTVSAGWSLPDCYYPENTVPLFFYYFFRTMNLGLIMWVFLAFLYDTYLTSGNLEELTYSLSTTVLFGLCLGRTIMLSVRKNEFEKYFQLLHNNFFLDGFGRRESDARILDEGESRIRRISALFYALVSTGLFIRGVCHLVSEEKSLMVAYPLLDNIPTPLWEFLFVIQSAGIAHFLMITICQEMVIFGFFVKINNHFEIMEANIGRIGELYEETDGLGSVEKNETFERWLMISSGNPADVIKYRTKRSKWPKGLTERKETTHKMLREIIIHHQRLVTWITGFNHILMESYSLQIFGVGLLLVILCADVIWKYENFSAKTIAQAFSAGTFFLDLTFLCILGTSMETKSHRVANALYAIPWIQMGGKNRRTVRLLLMALWKHPTIKIGSKMEINLRIYVKLNEMVYNCITFMHNVKN